MSKDLKRLLVSQEQDKQDLIQELIDNGSLKRRVRASKGDTNLAYTYVLDTGENALEALTSVSRATQKPCDWVDKVKHSPVYKNVIDYSINQNKQHPTFELMQDEGIWNQGSKRSIRSASTLSSLLNTLQDQVNLAVRVANLENVAELLIDHAIKTDNRLNKLENKQTTKEKALLLLEDGYNITEVSEITEKHRNTIKRWKNETSRG